ncbi:MAG: hypothetical protein KBD01_13300 [Acidobacteria bacterium]|nr:hypothetical protein [Acidobacteriota bacterium]
MQKNPLIKEYLDIFFRRKWWVVIPALLGVCFSIAAYFYFPKKYQATTRAQIRSQSISRALLNPIVEVSPADMVTQISAEITSERYMQALNDRLKLVGTPGGPRDLVELGRMLERNIDLDAQPRNRYFDLKVTWGDPRVAAEVANALAAIYIDRTKEMRAELANEMLQKIREVREKKEEELQSINARIEVFQSQHKFEIDTYRQTNIERLQTIRQDIARIDEQIRDNEDRIAQIEIELRAAPGTSGGPSNPRVEQLNRLRQEIAAARAAGRTDQHPALRKQLDQLAELERELGLDGTGEQSAPVDVPRGLLTQERESKLRDIEIGKRQRAELDAEAKTIQGRLELTPDREIALSQMQQTQERVRQEYLDARQKEQDAQEGEMVEQFGSGERIDILKRALPPREPFFPDIRFFLFMGLVVGAGLGVGLVLLLEIFDQSFKSEEQLAAAIDLPILAVIPDLTRTEVTRPRRRRAPA